MRKMFVKALLLALLLLLLALVAPSPTPVAIGEGRTFEAVTALRGSM